MSEVNVTQADRDAAKSLLGRDDAGPSWWSIDSGNADADPMVQAFARFEAEVRQSATTEALAAMEQAREALEPALDFVLRYSNRWDGTRCEHPSDTTVRARQALATLSAAIEQVKGERVMNRDELLALAGRVEALTGPDREVDMVIGGLTGMAGVSLMPVLQGAAVLPPPFTPAYTTSLDAAMSLPFDGFVATMGDLAADGLPGVCLCISTDPVRHVWGIAAGGGNSATEKLARAYTAAALRALAAQTPSGAMTGE